MRDPNHVEKAFVFAGMPAANGVRAAAMVASGCDGVADVFSGVPNFLDALSMQRDRAELAADLGERYEIMQTNIKKFAVGSPAQAAVQAMLELVEEEPIDPAQVAQHPHRAAARSGACGRRPVEMPDINCQYLVAGTLIDRAFTFAMAHDDDRMADPTIQALRARTELVPDPDRAGVRTADVTVTLRDGTSRQRFIGAVRGTVDDPMTDDEVSAKAVDLMEPVLGSATTKALMARLWSLERVRGHRRAHRTAVGRRPDGGRQVSVRLSPDVQTTTEALAAVGGGTGAQCRRPGVGPDRADRHRCGRGGGPRPPADRIVVAGLPAAARWAAQAHVLDYDDLHLPSTTHISTVCVPASRGDRWR